MDAKTIELAKGLVDPNYVQAGKESLLADERSIRSLIAQRKLPEEGLSDVSIEHFLLQLSMMDSNNNPSHCGAGEREGRVVSKLVKQKYFGMTHGIGRSGDLSADQPKAGGSSIMYQVTNFLVRHALHVAGTPAVTETLVVPMATGMTLALLIRSIAATQRKKEAKYVIWPRIDQKTCLKCIAAAGFTAVPVELRKYAHQASRKCTEQETKKNEKDKKKKAGVAPTAGGESLPTEHQDPEEEEVTENGDSGVFFLQSHPNDIQQAIESVGAENVVCVLTTTSCFAPRLPDDVMAIGRMCQSLNVPHVVNNAYGVQSRPIMKRLNSALDVKGCKSRVDAFVQSGDKNFLVPVGGAVIACGGDGKVVKAAAALYAGRASASPIQDIFITFLSLGQRGWSQLLDDRYRILTYFQQKIQQVAAAPLGEHLVVAPEGKNDISFMMTLKGLVEVTPTRVQQKQQEDEGAKEDDLKEDEKQIETVDGKKVQELGARLFHHCVTGPRVVAPVFSAQGGAKTISGHTFPLYGSHSSEVNVPVLVMACGVGMTHTEVDTFVQRLVQLYLELRDGGRTEKKKTATK